MKNTTTTVGFYPNEEALLEDLKKARSAGNRNLGADRAVFVKNILDAIVGKSCNWTNQQCRRCLRTLLETYAELDRLELLLAASGLIDQYDKIRVLSDRRKLYGKTHKEGDLEVPAGTLLKREDTALAIVAKLIYASYTQDPLDLIRLVVNELSPEELHTLGLNDILPVNPTIDSLLDDSLCRTDKITNLDLTPDPTFVGRIEFLQTIHSVLNDSNAAVVISGRSGCGKSRLCLEYARLFSENYQIIYWLDASDKDHLMSSVLDFFLDSDILYTEHDYDTSPADVFKAFFDVNQNYLLVFDNANLANSSDLMDLKNYLPDGGGHIIINSVSGSAFINAKLLHLDDFSSPKSAGEDSMFLEHTLKLDSLDDACTKLLAFCREDPLSLTLTTSIINSSDVVDPYTLVNMLEFNGVLPDGYGLPASLVAFDLHAHRANLSRDYYDNDGLDRGIIDLLTLLTVFTSLDLHFWGVVLPILPESVLGLVDTDNARKSFIKRLKAFGLYELRPGVIKSNQSLKAIANYYFDSTAKRRVLTEMFRRVETNLVSLEQNPYLLSYAITFKLRVIKSQIKQFLDELDKPATSATAKSLLADIY